MGPKTTNLTFIKNAKQPEKKPIFIPHTKPSTLRTKQPKKQLNNSHKILKKIPDIRILFLYTFQVKNLTNIKEKEFKLTTHKIYQGANVTITTMT